MQKRQKNKYSGLAPESRKRFRKQFNSSNCGSVKECDKIGKNKYILCSFLHPWESYTKQFHFSNFSST
jgi:hypothetical protein